ncbi:MAG: hypothetical protein JWP97_794 [Labilithrix sp.]|nr:hypothetical protein [Labilithrix sp.]
MFVGGRAWSAIADDPALARTIAAKLPAGGQTPSQLLPLVRCPSCAREMERGRWGASSSVIVDVCIMHGLWLDAGEIASLAEHAALRTRVGAVAARQATNASESRPLDLALLVADAASQARLEAAERRSRVVKRGGVLLLFAFVAARLAFAVLGGGTKSPPREVLKAGEAAASAATALGGR